MAFRLGCALLGTCALLAAPAAAEIREVAPGRYLCEAAAGHFSRLDVSHHFGGQGMAARIRFLEAAPDSGWGTAAGLVFQLDGGKDAMVLVVAPPGSPDDLWVVLDPPGEAQGAAMAAVRRSRTIELSATMARGAIFARSGNDRGQIYVDDARLTGRAITCSSGRFEIELTRNPRRPRPY